MAINPSLQAGVCIDFSNFIAGDIAIVSMEKAAKESRQVVFVVTRNWIAGQWSQLEVLIAGTLDTTGSNRKIIPLMCEEGVEQEAHTFIIMRNWIDFTNKNNPNSWKQLFTALNKPNYAKRETATPETSTSWNLRHPYPMPPPTSQGAWTSATCSRIG